MVKRKKPEPQFVISAPAPGGSLISARRLSAPPAQQHSSAHLHVSSLMVYVCTCQFVYYFEDND
jgi:hypothetical protein